MVTEQEEVSLGYLLDPAFQLINTNGKPLTGGWIECYVHGTRNKYYCYSDWNGTLHPFQIPLDSLGANVVLADPDRAYDVYVYNRFGSLVMSRYNVSPGHAGGAAISSGGNAEHWIGRYGATIQVAANEYSDSIPLPSQPDYEGTFIDRISDNKNIVLKDGLYLVDCLLSFRQNPDSLNNTLGYVHVFTGLDDGESGVFQRNETLPDTDPDETHNIRVQFVRHVEGSTGCNVCFQVRTTNAWSFVRIQGLSIVKLGAGGGIAPQPIEYDAGQYISIENDTISVTGVQPAGNYADASSVSQGFYAVNQQLSALSGQINEVSGQIPSLDDYVKQEELSAYATQDWVQQQGYLTSVPDNYVERAELSAYATDQEVQAAVSGKADKSEIPSLEGYATEEYVQSQVSGKADRSEIPSLEGYATQDYVQGQVSGLASESYVQSAVSGKQDALTFTYDEDNKITTIDGHGIAGTGGGGGSGAVYTPGQYISIQNDIISVTGLQPSGEYLTQNDLQGYATEEYVQSEVSGKADKSEIPSLDGYATQQWIGEQNFATVDDVDEATSGKLDSSAYTAPVNADWNSQSGLSQILNKPEASQLIPGSGISIVPSGDNYIINSFGGGSTYSAGEYISIDNDTISVTGLQPSGEYLVPSDLNGYATTEDVEAATSGKADVSAIPSLQGYATETWVSQQGYLTEVPAGYATEQYVQDQTSGFVDSGFVSQYVESEVSGKQDALQFTYNEEDKISAINGSAIAGGSEVPIGVMVESGLQYNAVGEISGYGDSAIAQYGAEKQWLVHDDTIVHQSNSAQYAFGVNISATSQLMGVDQTVLWAGTVSAIGNEIELSETPSNFEIVKIYYYDVNGAQSNVMECANDDEHNSWSRITCNQVMGHTDGTEYHRTCVLQRRNSDDPIHWKAVASFSYTIKSTGLGQLDVRTTSGQTTYVKPWKVIGIGRKQST